ncbi:3-(3-hydroxy-phenyl)propionate/3-hydroxycinnamic acid hydroxylase [Aspergillus udagawae]|uniref:3-(3-hydroxy-phenyl)propionate/3-hydroxycinnamic acid hydroxylase n=1 Tax=Aspergillus udagawae TaxID=91492 RepID=A0ABQ1BB54_9EURO|nr:3-(3-hydroxy-phenyl)propionate/3-hydroxycinnamic acid hydroxylase [Aspergillus udagawae]
MSSSNSPFKAIIVGGGPIGLAAAHALHLADIDFVVLERRPAIFEDRGASLIVHPHTLRVLHQFGILDELLPRGAELKHHLSFTADGHVFSEGNRYRLIRENHGHGPVAFHRAELIEIMYNGLPKPAKEKILTDKKLTSITTTQDGVTATCADGSVFHGSIVIGADGVYSRTRQVMRNLALKENSTRPWDPPHPYTATYQLIYGSFPSPSPAGQGYDTQSKGKSIMYFSGPERGWFFLYKRLARPTSDRTNYTEKEIDALAAEFAEFPLTKTVKVKDVWPRMLGAGLTNLDEGIAKHWSFGRIVLVGDACHKMTTHLGLGFNHGIQDVVVLCNSLRKALQAAPDRMGPDTEALTGLFEKYQAVRMSSVCSLEGDVLKSGLETRLHAWHNVWSYLLSWYLLALNVVENLFMRFVMAPEFRKGQVLDYVTREERMKGKISWIYPMSYQAKKED